MDWVRIRLSQGWHPAATEMASYFQTRRLQSFRASAASAARQQLFRAAAVHRRLPLTEPTINTGLRAGTSSGTTGKLTRES